MGTETLAWIVETRGHSDQVYRKTCKEHWHNTDFDILQKCILMAWIYLRNTKLHLRQSKGKKKCNKHHWTVLKSLSISQGRTTTTETPSSPQERSVFGIHKKIAYVD